MAAFELCFSVRKNFYKRKLVERLPLVAFTTRAFVFPAKLYYHKIFETRSR